MQPSEFWGLTVAEFNALCEFMSEYAREVERANKQ